MAESSDLMQTLIALEESRRDGWIKRDPQALRDLMAEDFMEINYFGRLSREDVLGDLFEKLTLHSFTMEDYRLTVADPEAAVLTYHCFEHITYQGNEVTGDFNVAATYVNRGGTWYLLLWQITPYDGA
jgi:hypothetical protein